MFNGLLIFAPPTRRRTLTLRYVVSHPRYKCLRRLKSDISSPGQTALSVQLKYVLLFGENRLKQAGLAALSGETREYFV